MFSQRRLPLAGCRACFLSVRSQNGANDETSRVLLTCCANKSANPGIALAHRQRSGSVDDAGRTRAGPARAVGPRRWPAQVQKRNSFGRVMATYSNRRSSPKSASSLGTIPSSRPAMIVARTVRPFEPTIVIIRTPLLSASARSLSSGVICDMNRSNPWRSSTKLSRACNSSTMQRSAQGQRRRQPFRPSSAPIRPLVSLPEPVCSQPFRVKTLTDTVLYR